MSCQQELKELCMAYPRTCEDCGLFGPCKKKKPAREWVGLTDEEIEQLENETCTMEFPETARAIEAKLKEKNT